MQLKIIFERLGLPRHSHIVYRAIEKNGPILATDIIKKNPIHRPAAYRALKSLIGHNFIFATVVGKRHFYHSASRDTILTNFSETVKSVAYGITKTIVSKEEYLQKEITFFEGEEGITKAFADVVEHTPRGETFYRYTSENDLEAVNKLLPKDYRALRDSKKIERLVISNPVSGKQKRPRLERFIRFIPPEVDLFEQNIIQLIYGDRISFIDLNSQRVIIIKNKPLAEFQKIIFRQLYKFLPK